MKAEINKNGTLIVIAENELETYALNQWHEENINGCTGQFKSERPDCFCIASNYHKITLFQRIKFKIQYFLYRH